MKSAPVQYLQYLHISTHIYTARRRGSLRSSTLQLPAGRRRRGLAENNKYHFLPPLDGSFGTGGREARKAPQRGSASLGGPWGPRAGALSGAVVVGTRRRGRRRVHVGCCCGGGCGGGCGVHRGVVVVVWVRVRVRMRMVAVAAQAGQRIGRRPALGPEVVVVGGGRVLVGMVVQRLGRTRRL